MAGSVQMPTISARSPFATLWVLLLFFSIVLLNGVVFVAASTAQPRTLPLSHPLLLFPILSLIPLSFLFPRYVLRATHRFWPAFFAAYFGLCAPLYGFAFVFSENGAAAPSPGESLILLVAPWVTAIVLALFVPVFGVIFLVYLVSMAANVVWLRRTWYRDYRYPPKDRYVVVSAGSATTPPATISRRELSEYGIQGWWRRHPWIVLGMSSACVVLMLAYEKEHYENVERLDPRGMSSAHDWPYPYFLIPLIVLGFLLGRHALHATRSLVAGLTATIVGALLPLWSTMLFLRADTRPFHFGDRPDRSALLAEVRGLTLLLVIVEVTALVMHWNEWRATEHARTLGGTD